MVIQTIYLPHLPANPIHIFLFENVKNAAFLREQLMAGNMEFEYTFLDSTMILSLHHVLAAMFRAVNDLKHNRIRTKNVHSEAVFCLSPNNNIAESFRRFGLSGATESMLAIKVGGLDPTTPLDQEAEKVKRHILASVDGSPLDSLDRIDDFADLDKIRKVYKLQKGSKSNRTGGQSAQVNTGNGDEEREEMEAVILGLMALRGA
ncbi:CGI-121-domain-containing protein [Eremomyces bilateralis CBS 781.70]|uniref:EKC/KEOPS complex subunit CGI121 n=1 Tax=Eremomyces bilateralis CBS 781.70 TaxID=1392243 RepID=A0A6G1GDS9_9PEZI|nr:CGI-121-domain-containing protein [Eremomyces bilateralis CBS 781.70]KAF1816182.1 CGI-121-domain-containing protein [Eremomyces bilateralis CBS 781.70]